MMQNTNMYEICQIQTNKCISLQFPAEISTRGGLGYSADGTLF